MKGIVMQKCMKCKNPLEGSIPICKDCRVEFKDHTDPKTKERVNGFAKLARFLNSFEGDKNDLIYLIKSEISGRQSMIISSCRVVIDHESICLSPPDGHNLAKQKVDEINKLYSALAIVMEGKR